MSNTYQVSEGLREALEDKAIRKGLERLRRLTCLQELGAPAVAVEGAQRSVRASREELGARFVEVEALLPAYNEWAAPGEKAEWDWEERCYQCSHWIDGAKEENIGTWCGFYTYETRTCPAACPKFRLLSKPN